jgi:murein L,D-transpeptidase YcbB/YkuD
VGIQNKIFYNESSAQKLGWRPNWFGEDEFNEELIENITAFQVRYDLGADGLCGPTSVI